MYSYSMLTVKPLSLEPHSNKHQGKTLKELRKDSDSKNKTSSSKSIKEKMRENNRTAILIAREFDV